MTDPILLHAGFDGLDMAYRVTLPTDLHNALRAAKAEAVEARRDVPLSYGGRSFLVNGRGGAGGYAFAVDTGVMGANWWFKEPGTGDKWGARVSSRSLPLATKGIDEVKAEHDQFLIDSGMSFTEVDRRLSRIDYAIDFLLPEFVIEPGHFVTHAKRTKSLDGEFTTDHRGDKLNGIRIGKMPNAQIAIYDKRREVIDKRKQYWWDIWREKANAHSVTLSNKSPIWRFEFRAGKDFLEKVYRRKTWEAFAAAPSLAFEKIAAQTRLTTPQPDTNRARWPSAYVWTAGQARIAEIELERSLEVDESAIKRALFAEYLDTIGKQTVGLVVAQMAAYQLSSADLPAILEQIGLEIQTALGAKNEGADRFIQTRSNYTATRFGR